MHLLPPQLSIHGVIIPNQNHWKIHEQLEVASRITAGSKKGQLWDETAHSYVTGSLKPWRMEKDCTSSLGDLLHCLSSWEKNSPHIKLNLPCFMPIVFYPPTAYAVKNLLPQVGKEAVGSSLSSASLSWQAQFPQPLFIVESALVPDSPVLVTLYWTCTNLSMSSSTEVVQNSTCSLTDVDQRR